MSFHFPSLLKICNANAPYQTLHVIIDLRRTSCFAEKYETNAHITIVLPTIENDPQNENKRKILKRSLGAGNF